MESQIKVLPQNKIISCKVGESLLDVLAKNGFFIPAFCDGQGNCGKYKVKIIEGKVKGTTVDRDGYVLSCKAIINGNLTVLLNAV